MMTHPALDTGSARLAGTGYLRRDHLAAGDELRFAILDDEHVVGVVVHLGAAPHDALGDDDQTFILEDALRRPGYRSRTSLLSPLGRFAFFIASVIVLGAIAVFLSETVVRARR